MRKLTIAMLLGCPSRISTALDSGIEQSTLQHLK